MRARLVIGSGLAALAGCATKQPLEPQVQRQQTWGEFIASRPSTYIKGRDQELAAERGRLEALGLGVDYDEIRKQVDRFLPSGTYTMQEPGATAAILRRHRVDSTTILLLRTGYRARHLSAPQQARSLVSTAASSFGDADALVLIAPVVLVADLQHIEGRPDNSAYLVYRVTEQIKSAPPIGSEFRLLLNGPFPKVVAKPGDPPPPPPPPNPAMDELARSKRAVFYLQPRETLLPDRRRSDEGVVTLFGPMPTDGQRAFPGYHSATEETTLAALHAAARAQLCSPGYVPVAPDGSPSRC